MALYFSQAARKTNIELFGPTNTQHYYRPTTEETRPAPGKGKTRLSCGGLASWSLVEAAAAVAKVCSCSVVVNSVAEVSSPFVVSGSSAHRVQALVKRNDGWRGCFQFHC